MKRIHSSSLKRSIPYSVGHGWNAIRRGVSLIELMVVLSIIGTLMALVMPVLHSAREHSREKSCTNNLNQLNLAMSQYLNVKKKFPPVVKEGEVGGWAVEVLPFLGLFDGYQAIIGGDPNDPERFRRYHLPNVLRCPSRPSQHLSFNAHYAMEEIPSMYDTNGDYYPHFFFDAPVSLQHPWVNSLVLKREAINNDNGPHGGGYHLVGRGIGVQLLINGRQMDQ